MKPDMSPEAISRRLRRVDELVRVCRALAGPRRKPFGQRRVKIQPRRKASAGDDAR